MSPKIINCLRLPGAAEPPLITAFEIVDGRVITGAVMSGDRSSFVPIVDGVVALSEISTGPSPTSADDFVEVGTTSPLFAGHREWLSTTDLELARMPFCAIGCGLLAEAEKLATRLEPGAVVVVVGDDSGWATCSVAAQLSDQLVIGVIDKAGPLGVAGCRRWLGASDVPGNLTVLVSDRGTPAFAPDAVATIIDVAALRPSAAVAPPFETKAEIFHALINPDAPIDLNRARIGERLLSDAETKVLYWAGRAVSVAHTAERTGYGAAEVINILTGLQSEGFVRLQRLPSAMARLHVFWRTGEFILPLAEQTLGHIAKFGFRHFDDRVYIHNAADGGAITFGEAAEVVQRAASALHRDGVRKGDRVCVHAIPHVEVPVLFWACVHLGAVFVPIGSKWSREVASSVLDRCEPKRLFINDEITTGVPERWRSRAIRLDPADDTTDRKAQEKLFSSWLGNDQPVLPDHAGPDEAIAITFTSGTTGVPKGVLMRNSSVVNGAQISARWCEMERDDVLFTLSEYTVGSGFRESLIVQMMCGASTVIADPRRRGNVLGLADICRQYGVTIFRIFPAALRRLSQVSDRLAPNSLKALRLILSSCAPLHQETLDRLGALSSARIKDRMGSTEGCGPVIGSDASKRWGSVSAHGGHPFPDVVVQTISEDGKVIRDGAIGRLRIYTNRTMISYLDDLRQTSEVLQEGWYLSADMGQWQPNGPLRIAGRAVEMIKNAWGEMVFPSEIETILMGDNRVHEVAACGYTDDDGIERIAAFVIPNDEQKDSDRLSEDLKNRVREMLGDSKIPSVVMLVDDLPRLAREKVNKRELVTKYLQP